MQLEGKVAIVTGASRGIGKGIAKALAAEGAKIVVAARTEAAGKVPGTIYETTEQIKALGTVALPVKCDVTVEEDVNNMVKKTVEQFGHIDILVNNAGGSFTYGPVAEYPTYRFDRLIAVNVRGPFLCCRAVLSVMVKQRSGNIINISSGTASGHRYPGDSIYGMSKAALERFTLGLADEVKSYNIAVNAVQPGRIKTEGALVVYPKDFNWAGWRNPDDLAASMVWLAQQNAETFTGKVVKAYEFGQKWP